MASDALSKVHVLATKMWSWGPKDMAAIDACLSVALTIKTAEIPCWLIVIAPPSHGKTEMLTCIERAFDGAFSFDKLTPASLVSGIQNPDGSNNDLLPMLDGNLVLIKDMSPILEMNAQERNAIIGDLRSIYDGSFTKTFAKRGVVRYETRFNMLAAATPTWENYYAVQGQLGQRFLQVRLPSMPPKFPDEERESRATLCKELTAAIKEWFGHVSPHKLTETERKEIFRTATRLAMLRGVVPRDSSKAITGEPQIEGPYRLFRQLCVIASGSSVTVAKRVSESCIPSVRARTIEAIMSGKNTIDGIAAWTKMARTPTERYVEDLVTLGVVSESGSTRPYRYVLTDFTNGGNEGNKP